jgi:hypothetical protein
MDVEYGWISGLQGKEPQKPPFENCAGVQKLRDYSARCYAEIAPFIYAWNSCCRVPGGAWMTIHIRPMDTPSRERGTNRYRQGAY